MCDPSLWLFKIVLKVILHCRTIRVAFFTRAPQLPFRASPSIIGSFLGLIKVEIIIALPSWLQTHAANLNKGCQNCFHSRHVDCLASVSGLTSISEDLLHDM